MVQFSIEELLCKDGVNIWRLKGLLNKKKSFSVAIWYSKTFFFPSLSLTKQWLIISLAFWFISLLRMVINFSPFQLRADASPIKDFFGVCIHIDTFRIMVINRLYPGKNCPLSLSGTQSEWSVMTSACSFGYAFPCERIEIGTQGDCNRNPGHGIKWCMNGVWLISARTWVISLIFMIDCQKRASDISNMKVCFF